MPLYDGISRIWKVGHRVVSKNRCFTPKLKQRSKKISSGVVIGGTSIIKNHGKLKYKPKITLKNIKIIGNKISATVLLSGKYKLNGKLIKINGTKIKVKNDKAKVLLTIKNKIKIIYVGDKYTKKTSKTFKVY